MEAARRAGSQGKGSLSGAPGMCVFPLPPDHPIGGKCPLITWFVPSSGQD